jgi:DNA-binding XRE family transcriptional regulator
MSETKVQAGFNTMLEVYEVLDAERNAGKVSAEDLKRFAARLKKLRTRAGLTQTALGERLGVPEKAVSNWERGLAEPGLVFAPTLAKALDVSLDALAGEEDEPAAPKGKAGQGREVTGTNAEADPMGKDGVSGSGYATAIHEAGHAVVGLALGRAFSTVHVNGAVGAVRFEDADFLEGDGFNEKGPTQIRERLTIDVAGNLAQVLAEELATDERWDWLEEHLRLSEAVPLATTEGRWEARNDLMKAIQKGMVLCHKASQSWPEPTSESVVKEIAAAEERAEAILRERWADVEAIAVALCRKRSHRLTYAQVLALLGQAQPPGKKPDGKGVPEAEPKAKKKPRAKAP